MKGGELPRVFHSSAGRLSGNRVAQFFKRIAEGVQKGFRPGSSQGSVDGFKATNKVNHIAA
jgi:hypothetical protein